MLAKYFYLIISSDESTTNFLISKNVLANNENGQLINNKYGSDMYTYVRKEAKIKERFRLQTTKTTFHFFFCGIIP